MKPKPWMFAALAIALGAGTAARADTAIVAGGCFWCTEADMEHIAGVSKAVSGFDGGTVEFPTYEQVSEGGTGHYEAVEVTFDPKVISYKDLVAKFLRTIDVTDDGGQFCDRGPTYRTAVFYRDDRQKADAAAAIAEAEASLGRDIVTELLPAGKFWPADAYHQDYYKSTDLVLTRIGPKQKQNAYKFYREACGRDDRIRQIWGDQALLH